MGKDKPLGGKAAAAKEAKDKAAVAAAKEKGVEMCDAPVISQFMQQIPWHLEYESAVLDQSETGTKCPVQSYRSLIFQIGRM